MKEGEQYAWERVRGLDPGDVCRRCGATHDAALSAYRLPFYGETVVVSPGEGTIAGDSEAAELLLGRFGYFSRISILTYLATSRAIPPAGRLIAPAEMKTGDIYFRGSHVLPLNRVSAAFGSNADAFVARGRLFGGNPGRHGDASLRFLPFHNFAVEMILWLEDDEFPARADLLFDAAVDELAPPDIVWSVGMLTTLVMLP
jgi:hypothetical protein